VTDHIARRAEFQRELRVAFDLVEERRGRELQQIREQVQPPAVRHGQDDLLHAR
jgi:hypothetical protein